EAVGTMAVVDRQKTSPPCPYSAAANSAASGGSSIGVHTPFGRNKLFRPRPPHISPERARVGQPKSEPCGPDDGGCDGGALPGDCADRRRGDSSLTRPRFALRRAALSFVPSITG